jgi:chemotaxis protein MotB
MLNPDTMQKLKEGLEKSLKNVPNFDKLKDHIEMTVTSKGLRIDLLESSNGTFFDSGSPKLNADGQDMLIKLARELGNLPNTICIEGHTNAKPYGGNSTYTNWELSADRANSARHVMQGNGLRPDQISQVRGFADQMLRRPSAPLDPSNRRISVIVQYVPQEKPASAATPPHPGILRRHLNRPKCHVSRCLKTCPALHSGRIRLFLSVVPPFVCLPNPT